MNGTKLPAVITSSFTRYANNARLDNERLTNDAKVVKDQIVRGPQEFNVGQALLQPNNLSGKKGFADVLLQQQGHA